MRTRARAALQQISEDDDVDVSSVDDSDDDRGTERNFRTSHLLGNPAVVQRRMRRHRDDESRRQPQIEVNEDDDEDESEEEEASSEGESDGEGGGTIFGSLASKRKRSNPKNLMEAVEDPHTEKVKYLTLLSKYAMRNDEVSHVIPNKRYGLDTPLSELKEVVQLCESILKEKQAAVSKRFGVEYLNKITSGLAGMVEAVNINLLDPEQQFPIDGLHDGISAKIEAGDFEGAHERMWEIIGPKFGALQNPFVQWGMMFGAGVVKIGYSNKAAYDEGLRPDPRKTRQRIKAAQQQREEQEQQYGDGDEEQGVEVEVPMSAMAQSVQGAQKAFNPVGVMGRPNPVDFGSDSEEEDGPPQPGFGTGLPPAEEESGPPMPPMPPQVEFAPIEVFSQ